ncbi:MAG TPA: DNA mismatch repair endonuclease MutL, partial [Gammaproteobacteria bacterium]|nr:DNA mismatch repair endonuclease MutL [Gammaproteobacteria bacterium]
MPANVSIARINRLPDNLVNRIAAGEVIERPASVVKELLENSLDAGATHINVEVQRAGSRLLRITDNGYGIHVDDLALALDRHTTSKLRCDSDLDRIATLGFRGEALSSIAAVSRLTLTSRWLEADQARSISLSPSCNDVTVKPAAHPPGTTVEVRDLFYNTPARRKFLRSEKTEFMHIQELVKRVALSRFDLKLRLQHNNHRLLQFDDDSHDPLPRLRAILGKQFTKSAIAINERCQNMSLSGWIGPADFSRSQSNLQFVFLNGRIVRDKLVSHAIRMAYQDFIHPGRHPVYALYLDMDLAAADVNVHPTKHEVRFRDNRAVHDFLYGSLVRYLVPQPRPDAAVAQGEIGIRDSVPRGIGAGSSSRDVNETSAAYHPASLYCLLQGRFVLAEKKHSLVLLDIYRARMVLARQKLRQASEKGTVAAQPVLVPLVYKDDIEGCERLLANADELARLAIEIRQVSPAAIQVRSLPRLLPYADILALIKDLLPLLKKPVAGVERVTALCEIMADHANDLAPVLLSSMEMAALMDEFLAMQLQLPAAECRGIVRELDA